MSPTSPMSRSADPQDGKVLELLLRPILKKFLVIYGYRGLLEFVRYLLANIVRELWASGHTQQELAEDLKVSRVTVGSLINDPGNRVPPSPLELAPSPRLLVMIIMSARRTAMTQEEIEAEIAQLNPQADARERHVGVLQALSALMEEGRITHSRRGPVSEYLLDHGAGQVQIVGSKREEIDRGAERAAAHADFQRRYVGVQGVGPRGVGVAQAHLTRQVADGTPAAIEQTILSALEAAETSSRSSISRGQPTRAPDDPSHIMEVVWFVSNIYLEPLDPTADANTPKE